MLSCKLNIMQDTQAALEVDAAVEAKGPELMNGLLQSRKLGMIFRLWDSQARGYVNKAAIAAVLEFYYRQVKLVLCAYRSSHMV